MESLGERKRACSLVADGAHINPSLYIVMLISVTPDSVTLYSSGLLPHGTSQKCRNSVVCNWTGESAQGKGWRKRPDSPITRARFEERAVEDKTYTSSALLIVSYPDALGHGGNSDFVRFDQEAIYQLHNNLAAETIFL